MSQRHTRDKNQRKVLEVAKILFVDGGIRSPGTSPELILACREAVAGLRFIGGTRPCSQLRTAASRGAATNNLALSFEPVLCHQLRGEYPPSGYRGLLETRHFLDRRPLASQASVVTTQRTQTAQFVAVTHAEAVLLKAAINRGVCPTWEKSEQASNEHSRLHAPVIHLERSTGIKWAQRG
jgi:hypothetical protein